MALLKPRRVRSLRRDSLVLIVSPSLAERQVLLSSERLLVAYQEAEPAENVGPVSWSDVEGEEHHQGLRLKIRHPKVRRSIR